MFCKAECVHIKFGAKAVSVPFLRVNSPQPGSYPVCGHAQLALLSKILLAWDYLSPGFDHVPSLQTGIKGNCLMLTIF